MADSDPLAAELAAIRERSETARDAGLLSPTAASTAVAESAEDVPRLLAAVEDVRKVHARSSKPTRYWSPCDIHDGNTAIAWVRDVIEACPNCSHSDRYTCTGCRNLCPDDDVWPCPTVAAITAALTGEDGTQP